MESSLYNVSFTTVRIQSKMTKHKQEKVTHTQVKRQFTEAKSSMSDVKISRKSV